ncbi:MAG: diphthine synthase [Candidatus Altiarchaeales archaeon]|nr:MAG: diphthine synthase [Candidatus Altiarchaeales archaeon]RLI94577.1 MAG: diphthine synthase [Candidatus Altiarchaeales archaeon]
MFYLIGIGLDEKDLSLRALKILMNVDTIYAEFYTSPFSGKIENIERLLKREVILLNREDIEENFENILINSDKKDVALLVPGDPMVATTHSSLVMEARKLGIRTRIIHSSSIYSAIAETGLQVYKFGRTTSLPFPRRNYFPTSPYDVIKENTERGLHTLILLDIDMLINNAIDILLRIEKRRLEGIFNEDRMCVGVARLGSEDSIIKYGRAESIREYDFGKPPHSLVVPGELHFMEEEYLKFFRI